MDDRFESKLKEEFGKLDKDYNGLQLVLDNIKDGYVCDCEKLKEPTSETRK